jgi:hypothetical protein
MPWPNRAPDWPLEIIVFGPLAQADSVAGVVRLELGNVALQGAGPNSLVFQNIFVPETFSRELRKG